MEKKLYIPTAFVYFSLVSFLGLVLRIMLLFPIPLNYKYILHTHSHIAFLGWVYSALFALFIYLFSNKEELYLRKYKIQFILTQVINIGMLISFPLQGYGSFSIFFSTAHILISFWFAFTINRDMNHNHSLDPIVVRYAKGALFFLVFSAIGPFALPIVIKTFSAGSQMYFNTIYFYLHFQYNGWFTFSILAFALKFSDAFLVANNQKLLGRMFYWLFGSVFCTLFLSFLWVMPPIYFNLVAVVGSIIQVVLGVLFLRVLVDKYNTQENNFMNVVVWRIILVCMASKLVLQCVESIPYFAELTYSIRNFIIGYLHLFFIGVVSLSIILIAMKIGVFKITLGFRRLLYMFIFTFLISEILLFLQGFLWSLNLNGLPFYFFTTTVLAFILFICSIFFLKYLR